MSLADYVKIVGGHGQSWAAEASKRAGPAAGLVPPSPYGLQNV
jgi:hypothetical protein